MFPNPSTVSSLISDTLPETFSAMLSKLPTVFSLRSLKNPFTLSTAPPTFSFIFSTCSSTQFRNLSFVFQRVVRMPTKDMTRPMIRPIGFRTAMDDSFQAAKPRPMAARTPTTDSLLSIKKPINSTTAGTTSSTRKSKALSMASPTFSKSASSVSSRTFCRIRLMPSCTASDTGESRSAICAMFASKSAAAWFAATRSWFWACHALPACISP